MKLHSQIGLAFLATTTCARDHSRSHLRNVRGDDSDHASRRTGHDHGPVLRIVGGSNAARDDFPFFVETEQCGGSLIAKDLVLSAAHCAGVIGDQVLVNAYKSFTEDAKSEFVETDGEHLHPDWDEQTYDYDIMLIKLKQPVTNPAIGLVPLAAANYPFTAGQTLTVTGFGDTTGNKDYSEDLLKVDVDYIDHATCNGGDAYDGDITENIMFCAGKYPDGGKDSCQGDSGGPILDANGYQVGVVSWGSGCGDAYLPGVYASVPASLQWIRETACQLSPVHAGTWACDNQPGPTPTPPAPQPTTPSPVAAPTTPEPAPTAPAPSPSAVEFFLEVQYDYYSWETGVAVEDLSAGTTVIELPINSTSETYATATEQINLVPGNQYKLVLEDDYGDGIEDGHAKVYAVESGGSSTQLAYADGNFAETKEVTFTVPSNMGRTSASASRSCVDTHKKFKVNDAVGVKGCGWLEAQAPRFDYLCEFVDVALACPKLCKACHWL